MGGIRQKIKDIFNKVAKNPNYSGSVHRNLFPTIRADIFVNVATDFARLRSQLEGQLEEQNKALADIEATMASREALEEELVEHESQAHMLDKSIEQFDLNCGYVTEKQFDNPIIYKQLTEHRKQMIDCRDSHDLKITRLKRQLNDPEKFCIDQQWVLQLHRTKNELISRMDTIVTTFLNMLELTQEPEGQNLLQKMQSYELYFYESDGDFGIY